MEMNQAQTILTANGIMADQTVVHKNGRTMDALTIGGGSVKPTLYEEHLVNLHNEEEMLDFAHQILNQAPSFDVQDMFTKEYFLSHVMSCIRPEFDDTETLTFPVYGDLQEYFRVFLDKQFHEDSYASVVVQRGHLRNLDITPSELRDAARKNLRAQAEIRSMSEIMAEMMGAAADELPNMDDLMHIASTKNHLQGASVMLLDDMLSDFCKDKGVASIFIIPSSIHEVILVTGVKDRSEINQIISEVNETTVSEMERLSDHVYEFYA